MIAVTTNGQLCQWKWTSAKPYQVYAVLHREGLTVLHREGLTVLHREGLTVLHREGHTVLHREGLTVLHREYVFYSLKTPRGENIFHMKILNYGISLVVFWLTH